MGQLADSFNNSAASLVAMCSQSNNAKLLIATYGELLTAVEVLENQLVAQIARLQGPASPDVVDIVLQSGSMGQLTDRFNNLVSSLVSMCNQSSNKAALITAFTELLGAVELLENQLAAQIVRLQGPLPAPVNTVLPSISGTTQVGQTLTTTNGTWTNSPSSFTYQWLSGGTPIGGATASTYALVAADVGNTITVSVTATSATGSGSATSAAVGPVIDIIPTNVSVPTISGTPMVNQVLTATTGAWTNNPTSYSYQWTDSSTGAIGGATASTYAPVSANIGHTLTVTVIATNSGGSSAPATSAATGVVTASGSSSTPYVVLLAA